MKALLGLGTILFALPAFSASIYSDRQTARKSNIKIQSETALDVTSEYQRENDGKTFSNTAGQTILKKKKTGFVNGATKVKSEPAVTTADRYLIGDIEITGRAEIKLSFGKIPVTMNAAITRDERNRVVAIDVNDSTFAKAYLEAMLKAEKGNQKNLNKWLAEVASNDLAAVHDAVFTERRLETTNLSCKNSAKGMSCKFTLCAFAEIIEK